jgi:hypothetical protein
MPCRRKGPLRVKPGKSQSEQMFSGLPPKADLPILELLPPPTLRERRHRGLARRRVAVRRPSSLLRPSRAGRAATSSVEELRIRVQAACEGADVGDAMMVLAQALGVVILNKAPSEAEALAAIDGCTLLMRQSCRLALARRAEAGARLIK